MRQRGLFGIIMPPALPGAPVPARLIPAIVLAYACLLPREMGLEVIGAALPPYRLALLAFLPFVIGNLAREGVRPSWVDLCAIFASFWFGIALVVSTSLDAARVSGLAQGLDLLLAYMVGRSALRTGQDWRTLVVWITPGMMATVLVLAAESLSHRFILRPALAEMFSLEPPFLNHEVRSGLLRATGPFPHPILGGVFFASAVPLAWFMSASLRQRLVLLATSGLGVLFTMSAAAVLGGAIAIGLILAHIVQRLTKFPVFLTAGFFGLLALPAISLASERGLISFMIRRLTFDAHNAYYRLGIWEFGSAEVARSPWFGIGQRDWIRPLDMVSASVDSYWLVLAMTYGLPVAIAVAMVMGGAVLGLARTQRWREAHDRGVASALMFLFVIVVFCGFTVHFWEGLHAWLIMAAGGSVSLASQAWLARHGGAGAQGAHRSGFAPWPAAGPGATSF